MRGRVRRKLEAKQLEQHLARTPQQMVDVCALCRRPLGTRVEWHHPVPKSEGGIEIVPVHSICHRAIHAHVSNHDLAHAYASLERLREREDMQRFLQWIADKPPDFHAPTRQKRTASI